MSLVAFGWAGWLPVESSKSRWLRAPATSDNCLPADPTAGSFAFEPAERDGQCPRGSSCGRGRHGDMARRLMAGRGRLQGRRYLRAFGDGEGAAPAEAAAGSRIDHAR